jgi:hypothetical protein
MDVSHGGTAISHSSFDFSNDKFATSPRRCTKNSRSVPPRQHLAPPRTWPDRHRSVRSCRRRTIGSNATTTNSLGRRGRARHRGPGADLDSDTDTPRWAGSTPFSWRPPPDGRPTTPPTAPCSLRCARSHNLAGICCLSDGRLVVGQRVSVALCPHEQQSVSPGYPARIPIVTSSRSFLTRSSAGG